MSSPVATFYAMMFNDGRWQGDRKSDRVLDIGAARYYETPDECERWSAMTALHQKKQWMQTVKITMFADSDSTIENLGEKIVVGDDVFNAIIARQYAKFGKDEW